MARRRQGSLLDSLTLAKLRETHVPPEQSRARAMFTDDAQTYAAQVLCEAARRVAATEGTAKARALLTSLLAELAEAD